jgi:hypothetical protein
LFRCYNSIASYFVANVEAKLAYSYAASSVVVSVGESPVVTSNIIAFLKTQHEAGTNEDEMRSQSNECGPRQKSEGLNDKLITHQVFGDIYH